LETFRDPQLLDRALTLSQGDHLCLLYNDPAEQLPVLLPFIHQGLRAGERCVYVADDLTVQEFSQALGDYGVDVATQIERGALLLWTRAEWRQPGQLESMKKAAQVRNIIEEALSAGFAGIRFGVEMTWTLGPDIEVERLRHWESTINTIFSPHLPARIICQYSSRRLSPEVIQAGLRTHPLAVIGMELCPNPYYEAPPADDGVEPVHDADARAEWMVSRIRWARAFENERLERLRAEAALKEAEESRRRADELRRLAEHTASELQRLVRVKDEFLAVVSHELRTPLSTVYGSAKMLRDRFETLTAETRAEVVGLLEQEARRLVRLVENLLTLARTDLDVPGRNEPLNVSAVVQGAVGSFHRETRGREVRVDVAPGLPEGGGDVTCLEQVVLNLLSNAAKYSPPDTPIDIAINGSGAELMVTVSDRGPGVAPENLEKIFDLFYRAPDAPAGTTGQGLGLAICKRLVEANAGRIWAEQGEGGGLSVVFTVPRWRATNGATLSGAIAQANASSVDIQP
jgi:signal transduction histidine kinase